MIDFRRILEALDAEAVRYVVIGGAALGLQGSAYRTEDIDIVYARSGLRTGRRIVSCCRRSSRYAELRGLE